MGRKCHKEKETAMEALYQILNERRILKRPEPSDPLFFLVKNTIQLWKQGTLDEDTERNNFWDIEHLSSPKNRKKRRLLLQTVSTWFQRRRHKTGICKQVDLTVLQEWKEAIQSCKPMSSKATGEKHARIGVHQDQSKKKTKRNNVEHELKLIHEQLTALKQDNEKLRCEVGKLKKQINGRSSRFGRPDSPRVDNLFMSAKSSVPVLHHPSAHSTPHMDYFVDGRFECQLDSHECCSGRNGYRPTGSIEFLDDLDADEIARLLE